MQGWRLQSKLTPVLNPKLAVALLTAVGSFCLLSVRPLLDNKPSPLKTWCFCVCIISADYWTTKNTWCFGAWISSEDFLFESKASRMEKRTCVGAWATCLRARCLQILQNSETCDTWFLSPHDRITTQTMRDSSFGPTSPWRHFGSIWSKVLILVSGPLTKATSCILPP